MTPRAAARGWSGAALLALTWAALLAPALTGHTLWYRDLLIYTYPQKSYVLERLLRAELPWWCERWGMGRPFFALTQPGALDPLNAALLLPHPLNLDVYNLAHLLVLMLGARAWLRREGCDEHLHDDRSFHACVIWREPNQPNRVFANRRRSSASRRPGRRRKTRDRHIPRL